MIIEVKDPTGYSQRANIPGGRPLGELLAPHAGDIDVVQINGRFRKDWQDFVGGDSNEDRVRIFIRTAATAIIAAIIGQIVSFAISMIISVLTPKPDKPNFNNRKEESSSIAGLHNAVESGSPRFYSFGQNRIYGTVISTSVEVAEDGKSMKGRVLYFMGRTDGYGIQSIEDIIINDQPIANHPDIVTDIRYGTLDQAVIPGFENVSQVFADNRTFTNAAPIIYTTRSDNANQLRAVISFSSLASYDDLGKMGSNRCDVKIERKLTADPVENFTEVAGSPFRFRGKTRTPIYFPVEITVADVGEGDAWDLRFTKVTTGGGNNEPPDPQLFNVEEIQWTTRAYANDALLALTNIPSPDFPSLENLRTSALTKGNLIPVPDGAGGFTRAWTRERVWIHRYITTSKALGLGARWEESEYDDDWAADEQDYYNELVSGHDADEVRDACDLIVNARQDGWDWQKKICGEGRAVFIPSGIKWRYVIDRPRTPTMLISEPGNVIENSVVAEPLQPDPAINRVIVEYRDGDNFDLPNVLQLVDPDFTPGDPIVADAVKLDTIKRESQAAREGMYYRKKQALVRRHWSAAGSTEFIYAEPMDVAYFYYPTASHKRGYSGFARGGTLGDILLDQLVELEAGETYQCVVHHIDGNTVETRAVTSAAGQRGRLTVSPDFAAAPADGDVWSVDKVAVTQRIARVADVVMSDDEPIRLVLSDYVPEVYNSEVLPPRSTRRFFDLIRSTPLPLRAAAVTEEIVQNPDGSHRSTLIFDVTPGFNNIAGTVRDAGVNSVALDITEPVTEDYFNGWNIEITEGTGVGEKRLILDYSPPPADRWAILDANWTTPPVAGSLYKLTKDRFGDLTGFKVEHSLDGVDWIEFATFSGTHGEYRQRIDGGLSYYRFTPISNGVENKLGRWVKSITATGDLSAPAPPHHCTLASHIKQVSIDIFQTRPTAVDLAGFFVQFQVSRDGGPFVFLREVSVPAAQDSGESGFMVRRHTENFSEQEYGDVIWAAVWSRDYSDNRSVYTAVDNTVTLREIVTGDIGEGALTEFAEYVNDAEVIINDPAKVAVASVTLATVGRPVLLMTSCTAENPDEVVTANLLLELRRGIAYAGSMLIAEQTHEPPPLTIAHPAMTRVDWPAPGTYTYTLWASGSEANVTRRHLLALEIKDQAQA